MRLHRSTQHGLCLRQNLILIGVQTKELDTEAIHRVQDWHQSDAGEGPGGQLEAAGAGQLHCQHLQEQLGQVFAQAGPHTTTKWEVMEAAILVLAAGLAEAVRVKHVHILEHRRCVVSVSDAIHDTPALRDLETLEGDGAGGTVVRARRGPLPCPHP